MAEAKKLSKGVLDSIREHTLENIERFKKANEKAILGKVLGAHPEVKANIPIVGKEIARISKEYTKLSQKEFAQLHKKYAPKKHKKEKVKKGLPELKKVDKKYVFRFPPGPSGPLHLGHIIQLLLNSEYAKKYKGKLVLRIEDTNPAEILPEAYAKIKEEATWITKNNIAKTVIQSKRIDDYYKHAAELIAKNLAYVCKCKPEDFRDYMTKKKPCPCRKLPIEKTKARWMKMFNGYDEGEAVLRIKTDVKHKNPAVRDWPALRISDTPHPLQGKKYRVWPLMNFSVAIDDHEFGLTHIIRGKDHTVNMDRQLYMYKYFDWWVPEFIHTGRVKFEGLEVSTRKFKKGIQEKKYSGWDDPQLPTIAAFKRRGLKPEAFEQYIHEIGPSRVDKVVDYEKFMNTIYAFNRRVIEKEANRYFIIEDPVTMKIKGLPKNVKAELPLHPDFPKRGSRSFHKTDTVFIEKKEAIGKNNYRLMHLCNFSGATKKYLSTKPDQKLQTKALHWLPKTDKEKLVKIKVCMAHGKDITALGEPKLATLKEGAMVQFERKFFARFDGKEKGTYIFYFTHK